MNKKEILSELQQWQAHQQGFDKRIAELVGAAEWETACIARLVGDTTGALKWWKEQCKYGSNPLSAAKGNKMRLITNLKQLAELIAE